MGCPKLLLPWGQTTLIGHLIQQWRSLRPLSLKAVLAQGDDSLARELDRLGVPPEDRIVNRDPANGMFSSIQCAARDASRGGGETHFAVVLGDQPQLRLSTLRKLVEFVSASKAEVCQPSYLGRPKHPVVFSRISFEVLASSPLHTLREVLASASVSFCESDDPGLELDVDTPGDYERVRRLALEDRD